MCSWDLSIAGKLTSEEYSEIALKQKYANSKLEK